MWLSIAATGDCFGSALYMTFQLIFSDLYYSVLFQVQIFVRIGLDFLESVIHFSANQLWLRLGSCQELWYIYI